jgi:hypothetical protein
MWLAVSSRVSGSTLKRWVRVSAAVSRFEQPQGDWWPRVESNHRHAV